MPAPRHADSNAIASQRAALHLLPVLVFPVLAIGLLTDTVRSFVLLYPIDGRALSPVKAILFFFFIFNLFFFSSDAQTSSFGASNDRD